MGTGICLFLHWENGIWVTGNGNHKRKTRNGKQYFQFRKSRLAQCLGMLFLLLRVSYLVSQWLRAATEHAQITLRQPNKKKR